MNDDDDTQVYKKPWRNLTEEEIKSLPSWWPSYDKLPQMMILVRQVEKALKDRNI